MKNRYQSLDVSLNLYDIQNLQQKQNKFSNTIDLDSNSLTINNSNVGENQDRINKFRDLYYKNQKLRKQLKLLNVKLNQKLEKIKLIPSKRKKAQSVDLNVSKPTKALQRQLQNAYKQVAMYKKQIATLKTKQESQSTYEKYKNLQNQISYKDIEITQIEAELKSIKNVKKIQDKTLTEDLQNQDLKERLQAYQRQFKQGQQKLKDIGKKARKRQQEYKKQQAYQVALQKKLRKKPVEQPEQDEVVMSNKKTVMQKQVNEQDFNEVKKQIFTLKSDNQVIQKKIDLQKKTLRDLKKKRQEFDQKFKQRDAYLKGLSLKLQSYARLIRDNEKKSIQFRKQTNYETMKPKNMETSKQLSYNNINMDIESEDQFAQDESQNYQTKKQSIQNQSHLPSIKNEREWKGKPRKVTFGFMDSNDAINKLTGTLKGLRIWIDETHLFCGLSFIYEQNDITKESGQIGNRTSNEILWQLQPNDKLSKIDGSFTEQGYLSQLILSTTNGLSAKLGVDGGIDKFSCGFERNEQVTGFYCGTRKLGQDVRITEMGFWISRVA